MASCILTSTSPNGAQVVTGSATLTVPGYNAFQGAFAASLAAVPLASQTSGSAIANANAAGLAATIITIPQASASLAVPGVGGGTAGSAAFQAAVTAGIILDIQG